MIRQIASAIMSAVHFYEGTMLKWFRRLTIHALPLNLIVSLIFRDEELEICFGVIDSSDLIFFIDEVTMPEP